MIRKRTGVPQAENCAQSPKCDLCAYVSETQRLSLPGGAGDSPNLPQRLRPAANGSVKPSSRRFAAKAAFVLMCDEPFNLCPLRFLTYGTPGEPETLTQWLTLRRAARTSVDGRNSEHVCKFSINAIEPARR